MNLDSDRSFDEYNHHAHTSNTPLKGIEEIEGEEREDISSDEEVKQQPLPANSLSKSLKQSFETFRGKSPNLEQQEEMKEDVYSSPLFLKKSLAASLKGVFSGFNLIPDNIMRRSSPTKLSALKHNGGGSHQQLIDEDVPKTDRSDTAGLGDLEAQERMDSELPLYENQTTNINAFTITE